MYRGINLDTGGNIAIKELHFDPDHTSQPQAMQREVQEEVGLVLKDFEKRGVLEFEFRGDSTILEVHIYKAEEFEGEPIESEEMRPEWFSVDDIPFDTMWPDDKHWFPLFLEGKNFKGKFLFQDFDTIVDYTLEGL